MADKDIYRGWSITPDWVDGWLATHPDYDPTPVHSYDPPGDSRMVVGKTRDEVVAEIDAWIEDNEPQPKPVEPREPPHIALRDHFAGQVLAGRQGDAMVAAGDLLTYARIAYRIADAMIAVREEETATPMRRKPK